MIRIVLSTAMFCAASVSHAAVRNYKCLGAVLEGDQPSTTAGMMIKGSYETEGMKAVGDVLISSQELGDKWGSNDHPLVIPESATTIYPTPAPEHAFEISSTSNDMRLHFTYVPFQGLTDFDVKKDGTLLELKGTCRFGNGANDPNDWTWTTE